MDLSELDTNGQNQSLANTRKRFGRYEVIAPLAEGGMAKVHLAIRDGADSICVLKRLHLAASDNAVSAQRFEREANLVAQLSHPNIAQVIDAGREASVFYIAMEYIGGKDVEAIMHHLMDQGRMLPYVASIHIALNTLKALAYAHQATDAAGKKLDLVHRDLSPRNIMLSFDGEVKVIDFGLARGKIDDFKTAPGMLMGTLRYISPEQALAVPVDTRSDLYTLSVLLWEMLAGRFLVEGQETTSILQQVVHDIPPPLSEINPHLPPELDAVLAKGLAKEVHDRWASAQDYFNALSKAAASLQELKPSDLGLFVQQLFGAEYEATQRNQQLAGPRQEQENTKAQMVSVPTQTAFTIPTRPKADKVAIKTKRAFPKLKPPASKTLEYVSWALCLIIMVSAAFIGTRFLEQVVHQPATPTQSILQDTESNNLDISAKSKPKNIANQPKLKFPETPKSRPSPASAKVKASLSRETKKQRGPSKSRDQDSPARNASPLVQLRQDIQMLQGGRFDRSRGASVLERIKARAETLPSQSDRKRIQSLAQKAMVYEKPGYFLSALDELEKLK
jgi:serine/threonine protein kinase